MQKAGLAFCALGTGTIICGCLFLFNRKALAMGNFMLIIGILLMVGIKRSATYFAAKERWGGSLTVAVGFALVFYRYTIIGMSVEVVGLLALFG